MANILSIIVFGALLVFITLSLCKVESKILRDKVDMSQLEIERLNKYWKQELARTKESCERRVETLTGKWELEKQALQIEYLNKVKEIEVDYREREIKRLNGLLRLPILEEDKKD